MRKIIIKIRNFIHRMDARINRYIDIDRMMRRAVAIERYIDTVIKYPKATLAITLIITIIMSLGLLGIATDNSLEVMMPGQDEEYLYYKNIQETFSNIGKIILIGVSSKEGLWNHGAFEKIDALITDLEQYKNFNEELETGRLNSLSRESLAGKNYSEFIDEYKDDPGMQRMIKRKLIKINKNKNLEDLIISGRMLSKLQSEFSKAIEIMKRRSINYIYSPLTVQDVKNENDTLSIYNIVKKDANGKRILPETKEEFDKLKNNLLSNPFFEKYIYSRDKNTGEITDFGIIILTDLKNNQDDIAREISDITGSYDNLRLVPSGVLMVNVFLNDYIYKDMMTFAPPILLLMILIYYMNFRTIRAILLALTVLVSADIWTIGLMGYLGFKITLIGSVMPALLMVVGSSYSIQLLNQYYLDFEGSIKADKAKGIKKTVTFVTSSIVIGSLTTVFGFLSIMTNQITAMRDWAIFTAIGICLTLFLTFTIIPAFFVLLPLKMPRQLLTKDNKVKITLVDKLMPYFAGVSINHYKFFLSIVVIIIIISIAGLFQIQVDTAPLAYFKKESEIVNRIKEIASKFGGIYGYNIIIDSGKNEGAIDPVFLTKVEKFREWLRSDDNKRLDIGMTNSFGDFIKKMHMTMNGNNNKFYAIPEKREDIVDYLELYGGADNNSDGRPDDFEPYIDNNYRSVQVLARIIDRENKGITGGTVMMERVKNDIQQYLDKEFKDYHTKVSGEPVVFIRMSKYVTSGQVTSFLQSLIVIFIAIMLLFKSYKAGLIATAPLITTVCVNFGIMGWFGIPLDVATAMIASIAIGTGDDVNIHFIHTYRYYRENGLDLDDAIRKTLSTGGRAILYSGMTLFLGFSIVGLSNFKPVMFFAILCGFSLIVTTMGALLLIPSIIKFTKVNLEKIESDSLFWKYFYIGRLFEVED